MLVGLLAEPSFSVTVLKRASSQAKFPASVTVVGVPDDYPAEQLEAAFQNQDVVVNAITSTSLGVQYRFIDAAIAAGVKRYIPSEFGLDNSNPVAQALSPVFKAKGEVRAYLQSREGSGLTWTAIACGMWLKWSFQHDFLGLHPREKKLVVWDSGNDRFTCTTMENTALALTRALLLPQETKNKCLYIGDFSISQVELFETIQRFAKKPWTRENVQSEFVIKDAKARYEAGDVSATYALIEAGFVTGAYGSDLEAGHEMSNALLGLPKNEVDDVVLDALRAVE